MYIADNLNFLKSLNDECVDLVCIDPPFAKNETFGRKNPKSKDPLKPPLSDEEHQIELDLLARWGIHNPQDADAAGINWPETAYKDFWSWEKDVHEDWLTTIEKNHRPIKELIEATQYVHGSSTAAYLCYMAIRLFEIKRVLKPTGSVYLHCDHTAGAYLRQLMDGIFGKQNFRNEIVWAYTGPSNTQRWFPRKHDTIMFYAKNDKLAMFNRDAVRIPYVKRETGKTSGIFKKAATLSEAGKVVEDWWGDITPVGRLASERTGYPTQKPVALAERIIKASCPEDGVVLDCFAGCAYVAVAAERLERRWVSCDINPRAWTVFKRQFSKPSLALLDCVEPTEKGVLLKDYTVSGYGPNELPVRESPDHADTPDPFILPEREFKVASSIFTNQEMLEYLLSLSGYQAWCCGFANRRSDGTIVETTRNFHLDHIEPASKDGANEIYNRAPLCPYHNIQKNNRLIRLAEYREEIANKGEIMVKTVRELPHLPEVRQKVQQYWALEFAKRRPQHQMPI